jgi:hypothetical protein
MEPYKYRPLDKEEPTAQIACAALICGSTMETPSTNNDDVHETRSTFRAFRAALIEFIDNYALPQHQPPVPEPFTNESVLLHAEGQYPPTLHDMHKANPRSWWLC